MTRKQLKHLVINLTKKITSFSFTHILYLNLWYLPVSNHSFYSLYILFWYWKIGYYMILTLLCSDVKSQQTMTTMVDNTNLNSSSILQRLLLNSIGRDVTSVIETPRVSRMISIMSGVFVNLLLYWNNCM